MQNENSRLDGSHSPFCILPSSFCIHPQIAELWNCGRRGTGRIREFLVNGGGVNGEIVRLFLTCCPEHCGSQIRASA